MRIRAWPVVVLLFFVLAAIGSPGTRADWVGDVNFLLGQKNMKSEDWSPQERQAEFGCLASFGNKDWPVRLAANATTSAKQTTLYDMTTNIGTKVTSSTTELGFGVYKVWSVKQTRPYVGAGIATLLARVEGEALGLKVTADGAGVGGWLDAGVFWRLGSHFDIGFALRYSSGTVSLDYPGGSQDVAAGGWHYGLLLGFGW